jgi:hypothetical protein
MRSNGVPSRLLFEYLENRTRAANPVDAARAADAAAMPLANGGGGHDSLSAAVKRATRVISDRGQIRK